MKKHMHRIADIRFFATALLLLIFLLNAGTSNAQYSGYKAITDVAAFKKQFATESAKILSIESDFTQEKTLTALTEKITSEGKFWFKRSSKVRIEYVKPFTYLMIMNGDKVLLRDGSKENRVNTKSNKLFQQVNRIMVDCMEGTIMDSKDFTVKVFENDKSYLLELTPSAKALKSFFETVVLIVEKKDYTVRSIDMNEPGGDKTTLLFKDKKLNTQLADAVFAL
jgi:outer membrane lipoprotein-sorting protein